MYYKRAGEWLKVEQSNNLNLRTDTPYQFEFMYDDISIAESKAAGEQPLFDDLPEWFIAGGREYPSFIYRVLKEGDVPRPIIGKLPDGTPITIAYNVNSQEQARLSTQKSPKTLRFRTFKISPDPSPFKRPCIFGQT